MARISTHLYRVCVGLLAKFEGPRCLGFGPAFELNAVERLRSDPFEGSSRVSADVPGRSFLWMIVAPLRSPIVGVVDLRFIDLLTSM